MLAVSGRRGRRRPPRRIRTVDPGRVRRGRLLFAGQRMKSLHRLPLNIRLFALIVGSFPCVVVIPSATASRPAFLGLARAGAAAAVRDGRIVFQANAHGVPQLFTINPDGSGLRQVTHAALGAEHATWSPDGARLVFEVNEIASPLLYGANVDGSGIVRLSPRCSGRCLGDGFPSFSRDGARIAFERTFALGSSAVPSIAIFTMNADGSNPVQLTQTKKLTATEDHEAQWLFDGKIAFTRLKSGGSSGAVFTMNADGTDVHQLTRFSVAYPDDAKWSPEGTSILFDNDSHPVSGRSANVFTMQPDGAGKTQLTHLTGGTVNAFVGAWSPDGKWIVWHRSGAGQLDQLFVMDAHGGHVRQLTHLPEGMRPQSPAWGTAG